MLYTKYTYFYLLSTGAGGGVLNCLPYSVFYLYPFENGHILSRESFYGYFYL